MEKQYLSEKEFTDIISREFCLFLFYKALSPMHHILQQYNRLN